MGGAVRPKTIVYFERIIFGVLLVGALQTYLTWDRIAQSAAAYPGGTRPIIIILIFIYVLFATLTLLVSRRRSKIAMWVLIALFALGLYGVVESVTRGQLGSDEMTTALGQIVQGVALGLLFTPSARHWMNRKDEKNEKLREVFE
jgi:ABC-type multidrug transport system fused ATPase/permease subunit